MKKILALALAAFMTLSMAACAAPAPAEVPAADAPAAEAPAVAAAEASPAEAAGEQITLRMAWWGSQTRHDRTIAVIEMYEKLHPEVKFEYEYYSFDDYFTKLKTLVASDQVWDVFQLGGNFPMYMDKIYFLNEFIDSGIVDISKIGDGNLKATQDTLGNQIGLSNGMNTYGIAFDPAMFAEAGIAEPTNDWTWDDYKAMSDTIHEKLGIFGCSTFKTSDFIAGCSVYVPQNGALGENAFFNIDLTGMGFTDPSLLTNFIQMRADMINSGSYPDAGASAEVTNIENDFLVTGEAAMTWVAVNQFPTIYDVCKEQGRTLKLVALPRISLDGPRGVIMQSSQMLCVSQDSAHKEAAAAFISWFQNDTECNNVLQGERGIPINSDVRAALSANATEGQKIMYDYMDLASTFEVPEKYNVLSPDGQDLVQDNYLNYIQQVASGEISASEAAEKTYADAQAIFNK